MDLEELFFKELLEASKRVREEIALRKRPKVYVISKYAGDTKKNVANAITYCKEVISKGKQPIASHLLYPQMLDDNFPEQRKMGLAFGLNLLDMCDEAWVFTDDFEDISEGMDLEIRECFRRDIPVRFITGGENADTSTGRY